jgi:hypothetical protein
MTVDRRELVGAELESVDRLERIFELCDRAGADERGRPSRVAQDPGDRATHGLDRLQVPLSGCGGDRGGDATGARAWLASLLVFGAAAGDGGPRHRDLIVPRDAGSRDVSRRRRDLDPALDGTVWGLRAHLYG